MVFLTRIIKRIYISLIVFGSISGCGGNPEPRLEFNQILSLPHTVAILMSEERDFLFNNEALMQHAYDRLESKTWQVLTKRGGVRVLERRNLETIRKEQHLQHLYAMDEESAVRIGGLVGAQGVLVYRIRMPSWRDRFLVEEELLPITFGGRLLDVETGTVLWSESLTVSPTDCESGDCWFGGKPQATLWPTLEKGIDLLMGEFSKAVPCRYTC